MPTLVYNGSVLLVLREFYCEKIPKELAIQQKLYEIISSNGEVITLIKFLDDNRIIKASEDFSWYYYDRVLSKDRWKVFPIRRY